MKSGFLFKRFSLPEIPEIFRTDDDTPAKAVVPSVFRHPYSSEQKVFLTEVPLHQFCQYSVYRDSFGFGLVILDHPMPQDRQGDGLHILPVGA